MISFLVTLREGIEVVLILSIIAAYLKRLGRPEFGRALYLGAGMGVLLSGLLAVGLPVLYGSREAAAAASGPIALEVFMAALLLLAYMMKKYFYLGVDVVVMIVAVSLLMFAGLWGYGLTGLEGILESGALLSAVVVLTYVTYWMARVAYRLQERIVERINIAVTRGKLLGIAALATMAVLREGAEVSLILLGAFLAAPVETTAGALVGASVAGVVGVVYVKKMVVVDWRRFFVYTSLLLVVFSSGILKVGLQDLVEVGVFPSIIDQTYNAEAFLPEQSLLGGLLYVFVGYTERAPLLPLLIQATYLMAALTLLSRVYALRTVPPHGKIRTNHQPHIDRDTKAPVQNPVRLLWQSRGYSFSKSLFAF